MNEILMKLRVAVEVGLNCVSRNFSTDPPILPNYVHNKMGNTEIQKTLFHTNNTNQRGDYVYSTNHIRKAMFIAPSFTPLIGRLQSLIGQQGYFQP